MIYDVIISETAETEAQDAYLCRIQCAFCMFVMAPGHTVHRIEKRRKPQFSSKRHNTWRRKQEVLARLGPWNKPC